jgi:hypothetical protein
MGPPSLRPHSSAAVTAIDSGGLTLPAKAVTARRGAYLSVEVVLCVWERPKTAADSVFRDWSTLITLRCHLIIINVLYMSNRVDRYL